MLLSPSEYGKIRSVLTEIKVQHGYDGLVEASKYLNNMIRDEQTVRNAALLSKYRIGQTVWFVDSKRFAVHEVVILSINEKSVSARETFTDPINGRPKTVKWRIHPSFLKAEKPGENARNDALDAAIAEADAALREAAGA